MSHTIKTLAVAVAVSAAFTGHTETQAEGQSKEMCYGVSL